MDYYKSISFNSEDFEKKVCRTLREDGVVVINDVLTVDECDGHMDDILLNFEKLETGIKANDISTWSKNRLPPQTRTGLFQALMSNQQSVWNVRSHQNIEKIFQIVYSDLRGRTIDDFIVSNDGINIRPKNWPQFKKAPDWAHLDQTSGSIFECVQGQAVLTNTTACFRCSPKSHLVFDKIVKEHNGENHWLKFETNQYSGVEKAVLEAGGEWQIPILAKKGSFIIWLSSVIHSARIQIGNLPEDGKDKHRDWRGIVYVCYRPREDLTEDEIKTRSKVVDENRTTNHRCTKIFPKKPGSFYLYKSLDDKILEYVKNPKTIYDKIGKPNLNDKQKRLAGLKVE